MAIRYTDSLEGITAEMLGGLFEGWQSRPSPARRLRMLEGSRYVVLAVDDASGRVVGLINAIADGCHFAFMPLLEVTPDCRGQGIGRELVTRMLRQLREYPCIDLTCDPGLQPFYERCGMTHRSHGMVVREYGRAGPH